MRVFLCASLMCFYSFGQTVVQEQILFTDAQIDVMISRLNSGYTLPGSAGNDISYMISEALEFLAEPTAGRLDWMPTSGLTACANACSPVPVNIFDPTHFVDDNIFYAAIYSYLLSVRNGPGAGVNTGNTTDAAYSVQLANAIATQILARTSEPGLDFSNATLYDPTDISNNAPYFLIARWLEKTMDAWSLIAQIQTNLSNAQMAAIDTWFGDGANYYDLRLRQIYSNAFGASWESGSFVSTGYNTVTPYGTNPFIAIGGVPQTAEFSNNFAVVYTLCNIPSKFAGLLHHYGLLYNDATILAFSERWFYDHFRFAIYPDGTSMELLRASASSPQLGVGTYSSVYNSVTIDMAHTHAVAVLNNNPVVSGQSYSKLYDFTTSEGLSDYLPSHFGSDTKGGIKGMEMMLEAWVKYLGQTNGINGWGAFRQVNDTGFPNHTVTGPSGTVTYYFPSIGQANAYFNNPMLESAYKGINNYPTIQQNPNGGAWSRSFQGPFGKNLLAFPYMENEGNAIYGSSVSGSRNKRAFLNAFYDN